MQVKFKEIPAKLAEKALEALENCGVDAIIVL